jgi:hypothetical protein
MLVYFSLTSQEDQKTDDNIAIKLQLDENELIFDSNAGQWYSGNFALTIGSITTISRKTSSDQKILLFISLHSAVLQMLSSKSKTISLIHFFMLLYALGYKVVVSCASSEHFTESLPLSTVYSIDPVFLFLMSALAFTENTKIGTVNPNVGQGCNIEIP